VNGPIQRSNWLDKILEPILKFFSAFTPLFQTIFWVLIVCIVALFLYIIGNALRHVRFKSKNNENGQGNTLPLYRPSQKQALILLEQVDALAAKGQYAEAVHQLLFKSIQDISIARPSVIKRSYTSREISTLGPLDQSTQEAFSLITREVERSHFGAQVINQEAFLRSDTRLMGTGVIIGLILIGLFSFSALITLLGYSGDIKDNNNGKAHVLSNAANPYLRLITLNSAYQTDKLSEIDPETPTLIILPKWTVFPIAKSPGWVEASSIEPLQSAETLSSNLEALMGDINIHQAKAKANIEHPDFLNTQGLVKKQGARFAIDLLTFVKRETSTVGYRFDLSFHGIGGRQNMVKLFTRPPFLSLTLLLIVLIALLGWQAFIRFGDPQNGPTGLLGDNLQMGPQSLAKTTADVLMITNREAELMPEYAHQMRQQTLSLLGFSGRSSSEQVTALKNREINQKITPNFENLNKQAKAVTHRDDVVHVAKALQNWKKDITK